ncbi:Glycine--tRNA ligase beta subunit [Halomicronema hongdechloris C2206]|uniref:Glycine--tRNA ligase beta subunit n=1 Tax=Halomicronema hongdechloris C2206 TaxID=1641165 RepID=A0A1Z3HK37_9CYAN|nr:glycine--tRNA ligase subunit beta [Halomicronema hongdechloris]ASC70447.1 Glycine--tRNA ligase beta subunit [Halomicronema hongdechloris C2206]
MATFLLEVGTEELPASFVEDAINQWRGSIASALAEELLTPAAVTVYGTPRRLAVVVAGLPERQPDRTDEVKGPPAQAAFQDGQPTRAAEGFARSRGVAVADLEVRDTDKGPFVFVTQSIAGRPAADILPEQVPQWIFGLEGKRFMRWGDGDLRFPRPIRWVVALLDDQVLPFSLENGSEVCPCDRISPGHRVLHPDPVVIAQASTYRETLNQAYVDVDPVSRADHIYQQLQAAASRVNGVPIIAAALLQEVTHLVEWPTAVVGKFDPAFLELPPEVITMEMESHQRYFPVRPNDGSAPLLPYFITVSNGDPAKADIIAAGNARVIRARLSDGKFFFDADRAIALETFSKRLHQVTFEERLGSMADKVDRIVAIADHIATQLSLAAPERQVIQRAAQLCKADLVTQMVGEFPELQGIMGEKYARHQGEADAVAVAIAEHYLPRGADDPLPQTLAGQVVGMADRLDTLVGIFSLGQLPSGSSDPFALRRAANAIVNVTWTAELPINLEQLLVTVIADFTANPNLTVAQPKELEQQLQDFFLQRIRTLLQDELAIDYDLVNAVLGDADADYAQRMLSDLLDARDRARFLHAMRSDGTLERIYETVNRATRLAAQGDLDTDILDPTPVVDPDQFQQPSEQAFLATLQTLLPQTQAAQAQRDYSQLVAGLEQATPVVSRFFDGPDSVLVMAEDAAIRRNRLNLLGLLRNHARVLADFGAIVKS